jgi:hypothetical protein
MKHAGGSVLIWAAIPWYSTGPLDGRITTSDNVNILGKQVHPMVQMFFHNSDAVFQDDSLAIHTAISVQSWLQKHEGALLHNFQT